MKHLLIMALVAMLTALTSCSPQKEAALTTPAGMDRQLAAAGENVHLLSSKQASKTINSLVKLYTPWQSVSIKGKVRSDMLPVSLSIKLYMVEGKFLTISLRVPLIGEMGRLEVNQDSAIFVNKRAKRYVKYDTQKALGSMGLSLSDLQNFLLGRIFVTGAGTLSPGNAEMVDVCSAPGDTWIVTPKYPDPRVEYGFTLYPDGKMLAAMARSASGVHSLECGYDYQGKQTLTRISAGIDSKIYNIDLTMDPPDFSPNPIEPLAMGKNWKQVTFKELLKSFD